MMQPPYGIIGIMIISGDSKQYYPCYSDIRALKCSIL